MSAVVTVHIIDNLEITLTECGESLAAVPMTDDLSPQALTYGADVALWDNAETPVDAGVCVACFTAYQATQ